MDAEGEARGMIGGAIVKSSVAKCWCVDGSVWGKITKVKMWSKEMQIKHKPVHAKHRLNLDLN